MPRPAKGPRLWYYKSEDVWVIRDAGQVFIRTGCRLGERESADQRLGEYLSEKFQPTVREGDLSRLSVAEVLTAYAREHAPFTRGTSPANAGYNIAALLPFWGTKTLADVRGSTCRAYAEWRRHKHVKKPDSTVKIVVISDATIRRELVTLSAAIGHWHREHGPLDSVPVVTMPDKPPSKADWLTRRRVAYLLAGALGFYRVFWSDIDTRRQHIHWCRDHSAINRAAARFILLALYSGTRHTAVLAIQWMPNTAGGWVALERRVLHRRGIDETETNKRRPPVRLGRRILAHLARWKRIDDAARETSDRPYLHVVAYKGEPIQKLRKPWYRARELAWEDDSVTPHILRHTRATWVMQNGVDLWEAAGALGMSVKTLEDTYGHHHPDWQKNVAEV